MCRVVSISSTHLPVGDGRIRCSRPRRRSRRPHRGKATAVHGRKREQRRRRGADRKRGDARKPTGASGDPTADADSGEQYDESTGGGHRVDEPSPVDEEQQSADDRSRPDEEPVPASFSNCGCHDQCAGKQQRHADSLGRSIARRRGRSDQRSNTDTDDRPDGRDRPPAGRTVATADHGLIARVVHRSTGRPNQIGSSASRVTVQATPTTAADAATAVRTQTIRWSRNLATRPRCHR